MMMMMSETKKMKNPIIQSSLFINPIELLSTNSIKSPRNFERGVVGLCIVAAMEDETETFHSPNIALSPKTQPIPIVYGPKFRHPIVEKDEMEELSESYTCVISKFGKREYFDDEPHEKSEGMFLVSPVKWNIEEGATMFQAKDFLSFCYLCNKHLHGLDIFMYRGDKAFCSAECRSRQIMVDDHKEKYGNGVLVKSLDYSVSPCSAPVFFPAGVAAA